MIIALKSISTGKIVSSWDEPHNLIANRNEIGIGEQFEVIIIKPDPTPTPIPIPGPDPSLPPKDYFMALVDRLPCTPDSLLSVRSILESHGWQYSPPNHADPPIISKILPPGWTNYVRVGFGEGHWVWIVQSSINQ